MRRHWAQIWKCFTRARLCMLFVYVYSLWYEHICACVCKILLNMWMCVNFFFQSIFVFLFSILINFSNAYHSLYASALHYNLRPICWARIVTCIVIFCVLCIDGFFVAALILMGSLSLFRRSINFQQQCNKKILSTVICKLKHDSVYKICKNKMLSFSIDKISEFGFTLL